MDPKSPTPLTMRFSWVPPSFVLFENFLPLEHEGALEFDVSGLSGRLFAPEDQVDELDLEVTRNDGPGQTLAMLADHIRSTLRFELELKDPSPDPQLLAALREASTSDFTWAYGERLVKIVAGIQGAVLHFLRFRAEHYWIQYRDLLAGFDEFQWYLDKLNSRWKCDGDEWSKLLLGANSMPLHGIVFSDGVTKEAWEELATELAAAGRAPMWQVLITNSLEHLVQRDERLAVVEAVMALEVVVKSSLPAAVTRLATSEESAPTKKAVEKLLKRAGFHAVLETFVPLLRTAARTEDLLKAIELRNEIIHSARRTVGREQAREAVGAVLTIIEDLKGIKTLGKEWAKEAANPATPGDAKARSLRALGFGAAE